MVLNLSDRFWLVGSLFGRTFQVKKTGQEVSLDSVIESLKQRLKKDRKTGEIEIRSAEITSICDELKKRIDGDPRNSGPDQIAEIELHRVNLATILDDLIGISYFTSSGWNAETGSKYALMALTDQIQVTSDDMNLLTHVTRCKSHERRADALTIGQSKVALELNRYLADCQHAAVHMPFDTLSGAAFMCSCLPLMENCPYIEVFVLRPQNAVETVLTQKYMTAIRQMARILFQDLDVLPPVENMFSDIPRIASERGALLVFASANCLSQAGKDKQDKETISVAEDSNTSGIPLRTVLSGLSAFNEEMGHAEKPKQTRIVFLAAQYPGLLRIAARSGTSAPPVLVDGLEKSLNELNNLTLHEKLRAKQVDTQDGEASSTFEVFHQEWTKLCAAQKAPYFFEHGTRLKIAFFWYVMHTQGNPWQRSIKMRAAAANNQEFMGFADGTAGINSLLAHVRDRPDIDSDIQDVLDQIALLDADNLRSLRFISSGRFWVREQALQSIYKELYGKSRAKNKPSFKKSHLEKSSHSVPGRPDLTYRLGDALIRGSDSHEDTNWAEANPTIIESELRYRATLDVKAIVFDHWRQEIKNELEDENNTKKLGRKEWSTLFRKSAMDLMNELSPDTGYCELPISPEIGEDIQVWSEVFRKLIRSVEHDDCGPVTSQERRHALDAMTLIDALETQRTSQSSKREMIRICFQHIFVRRFRRGRMLGSAIFSRDDRADSIAAEMLQLISHNSQIGFPSPCLDEDLHEQYFTACASAMHAIGYSYEEDASCGQNSDILSLQRLSFEADTKSLVQMEDRLRELRTRAGLDPDGPAPEHSEQIPCKSFLAIIKLMLLTGKQFDSVGEALGKYAGENSNRLVRDEIQPKYAHQCAYVWDKADDASDQDGERDKECKIQALRLFAQYHEMRADRCKSIIEARLNGEAICTEAQDEIGPQSVLNHLTKAASFLDHGIDRLNQLDYQNERMRFVVLRQRIARKLTEETVSRADIAKAKDELLLASQELAMATGTQAELVKRRFAEMNMKLDALKGERNRSLFVIEGRLNDLMRRAMQVGCAFDVFLELLIESAYTLEACDRPIRAYCGYAVPALNIIRSINYWGHEAEGKRCADHIFSRIEALYEEECGVQRADKPGTLWDRSVDHALQAQQKVEEVHKLPVLRIATENCTDLEGRGTILEGTPVFGYLLPQVCPEIEVQRNRPKRLH